MYLDSATCLLSAFRSQDKLLKVLCMYCSLAAAAGFIFWECRDNTLLCGGGEGPGICFEFYRLLEVGRKLDRTDEEALNACAGYLAKMGQVFICSPFFSIISSFCVLLGIPASTICFPLINLFVRMT